jgi:hypothetical protein
MSAPRWAWWLSGLTLALDQATKHLAEALLVMHEPVPVLPSFNLTAHLQHRCRLQLPGRRRRLATLVLPWVGPAGQHRPDRLAGAAQTNGDTLVGGRAGADSGRALSAI